MARIVYEIDYITPEFPCGFVAIRNGSVLGCAFVHNGKWFVMPGRAQHSVAAGATIKAAKATLRRLLPAA